MNRKFELSLIGLLLFFLVPAQLLSQNHAKNWYFGKGAGLEFSRPYPMPVIGGKTNAKEGVASISDSLGNLKFYTDGITVWNFNHDIIADGLPGHISSTMSATILPSRINPDQYFLFTTSTIVNDPDGAIIPDGGHYFILDFSSSNPEGKIISDYSTLGTGPIQNNSVEKFLGIPFPDTLVNDTLKAGYWLLTHEFDRFSFKVSQFDDHWVSDTIIDIGTGHSNGSADFGANRGAVGYIAATLSGDKIAVAIEGQKIFEVFRFDTETGKMRRFMTLPAGDPAHKKDKIYGAYGVQFSPSGRFLYGSSREGGVIYQWDLNSPTMIQEVYILRHNPEIPCGALQLAPNGKIYLAIDGQDYLGVVNRPDRIGKRAAFEEYGARLRDNETGEGGSSTLGLPQFDMSAFELKHFGYDHNCNKDTTILYMNGGTSGGYSPNTTFTIIDPLTGGLYDVLYPDDYLMARWVFPGPGEYDVRVQSRHMGVNLDFIERITIYPLPEVSLTEKDYTIMCRGDSLELDAGNGAFYEWADESYRDRAYMVTDLDFANVLRQEFRVRVVDYTGCIGWDTVQIEIKSPPKVDIAYTKAICGEPTGSATVTPLINIDNYYFRWEEFPENTTNKIENVLGGNYTVYVTSRFAGCEASFLVTVPELGGANVDIVPSVDSLLCPGTELFLTVEGEGASEYLWLNPPGEVSQAILIAPLETTTYRVQVIAREGDNVCTIEKSYTVEVSIDQPLELGEDLSACEGEVINFEAPVGYAYYLWNNQETDPKISISHNESLVLLTKDFNGCQYEDDINFTFYPAPVVNLGDDLTLCTSDPIHLTGGTGDSYLWSTGETDSEIQVGQSGTYSLQITEYGCISSDTVTLNLLNPDSLVMDFVDYKDITCFNAADGQIEMAVHGMGSDYLYSIDDGETYVANDGVFKHLMPGVYNIRIMEDSLCYLSYESEIEFTNPAEIIFDFQLSSPSCEECLDGSILITDLQGGTEPYTIKWNAMDYGARLAGLGVGYYGVKITDSNNCSSEGQILLDMGFIIPNAFTPNGDGYNDEWKIKILRTYKEVVVKVYSAYGKLVFESPAGYPEPWDGKLDGSPVPMGTYYYLIYVQPDQTPYTGSLSIIR